MKKLVLPILLLISILLYFITRQNTPEQIQSTLLAPATDLTGFVRAEGPIPLKFPIDQGPHPDYLTEWWYYTGNLDTPDSVGGNAQHFGFQLTFFRRALAPPTEPSIGRTSDWATDQAYLAHFALTDVTGEQFHSFERFSRGAVDLAGAQAVPYHVWLENWTVEEIPPGTYALSATEGELQLKLELTPTKDYTLHGNKGYSQKGPQPGNASYYISQTRLEARGEVTTARGTFPLTGLVWMDHEYSTQALSDGQIGWDWFSIQLSNNTELMLFQIRRDDGTLDSFSSGTIIYPDGATRSLTQADFTIHVLDTWQSPHSKATYPAQWQVTIPSENLSLELEPWLADQELQTSVIYWEGAVQLTGTYGGEAVSGNGYVEMTGYSEPFDGDF